MRTDGRSCSVLHAFVLGTSPTAHCPRSTYSSNCYRSWFQNGMLIFTWVMWIWPTNERGAFAMRFSCELLVGHYRSLHRSAPTMEMKRVAEGTRFNQRQISFKWRRWEHQNLTPVLTFIGYLTTIFLILWPKYVPVLTVDVRSSQGNLLLRFCKT
jgi:hypothetical protein